ncbi:cytosine permease [Gordonia desulfuricans]|nr:cytosine permease [Gordonia desulfuricans]
MSTPDTTGGHGNDRDTEAGRRVEKGGGQGHDAATNEQPLLRSERIWSFRKFSGMNITFSIATWAFLQGGAVAAFVGAKAAIASIVIGYGISVLLVSLAPCIPTAKYGFEMFYGLRSIFGPRGIKVIMVVIAIELAAWVALLGITVGHSATNVADSLTGSSWATSSAVVTIAALIAIVLSWVLLSKGPERVGRVGDIAAPVLVAITVAMLVMIFTKVSVSELFAAEPLVPMENKHLAFMIAVELNIAGGFAWYPAIGNLARLTNTPRASFWPNMLGLFAASSFAAIVGAFAALTLGSDDPTVWMIPLGGAVLGILIRAFIAFANLTSMVTQAYSALMVTLGINTSIKKIPWVLLTALFLVPVGVICLFPEFLYDSYGRFLTWVATLMAPLCAIQLVDFFILRRRRIDLRQLYADVGVSNYTYWRGWNPVAFGALALGVATYVTMLHPVSYEPNPGFQYLGAFLPSFLVAGTSYLLGTVLINRPAGRGGYRPVPEPVSAQRDSPSPAATR